MSSASREAVWINLNVTEEPLDDPLVREAIALAINRDEHAALRGAPVSEIIYSVVPAQFMPGGLTQEEAAAAGVLHEQDIERARELLAEAGYADGFSIDLITSEMTDYRANYEVLQAELAEIGITLNLHVVDHATMHEQIREDVNPIVIYVAYRPNADVYLTNFFHSDSIVVEGASPITNFSHYSGSRRPDRAGARRDRSRGARRALEAGEHPDPEGSGRHSALHAEPGLRPDAWRRLRARAGLQSRPLSADHRADDGGAVAPASRDAGLRPGMHGEQSRSRGTARRAPRPAVLRKWLELEGTAIRESSCGRW